MSRWEYEFDLGYDKFKNIEEYLPAFDEAYMYRSAYIYNLT